MVTAGHTDHRERFHQHQLSSVTGSNLKAAVHPKERDWKENKIEHLMIDELRNSFRLLGSH